jgi:hypothetical protein
VEHVDEFGRSRLVRQSEIPPPPAPEHVRSRHDAPGYVILSASFTFQESSILGSRDPARTLLTIVQPCCFINTNRIHNPANPFPVFRNQDAIDKEEWIKDATGEMVRAAGRSLGGPGYSQANSVRHYDNTTERRARGVGFYAFSQDEEERARQMRELLEMRTQVKMAI